MVHTLDTRMLGRSGVVASALIEGPAGLALVDPGPASSLDGLRAALSAHGHALEEVDALLLTHIHLDHAGAAGTIVRQHPRIRVYVHERGAPHVVDPGKLIRSASRLYGAEMERLWGDIAPVPAGNVQALAGGERLRVAGLAVEVAYTPGHASHHVCYFEPESGTAFVGDTGGIRVGAPLLVIPPTPPPDIDLAAWDASLDTIRAWHPQRLFLAHFGAFDRPAEHLAELQARLHQTAAFARSLLSDAAADDGDRRRRFVAHMEQIFRERLADDGAVRQYELAVPLDHCWQGLERYWTKMEA